MPLANDIYETLIKDPDLDLMIQENYVSLSRHESSLKFKTKNIIEDNDLKAMR